MALAICLLAMASITLGTIWQKRTGGGIDMRVNAIIQYLGAMAATLPLALLTERFEVTFAWQFWAGLLWAVCGLSIGAIGLLLFLIRRGAVAGVAALLYLVPPVSAIMAYFAFGETLSLLQIAGMAVAAGRRRPRKPRVGGHVPSLFTACRQEGHRLAHARTRSARGWPLRDQELAGEAGLEHCTFEIGTPNALTLSYSPSLPRTCR